MAGEGLVEEPRMSPYGEMQDWHDNGWMARRELNEYWALYTPVNGDGSRVIGEDDRPMRAVPILRVQLISDEVIAEGEARWAAKESHVEIS